MTGRRVALVTGAALRVGRAITLRLAEAGFDVAIHFNSSATEASALADRLTEQGRRATLIQADLVSPRTWPNVVQTTVNAMGQLDVLVNNASVFPPGPTPTGQLDVQAWEDTHRINTVAPVALCHLARPHLSQAKPGRIINLVDIAAWQPWSSHEAYCASKAGLTNATKTLAKAWAPDILINGIAPGIAIFPEDYSEDLKQRLIQRVPLQRAGTPEDIAEATTFLATSATYMTGQIIAVDGGRSLQW